MGQWIGGNPNVRYTMPFRENYTNCGPLLDWTNLNWREFTFAYDAKSIDSFHNGNLLVAAAGRTTNNACEFWFGGTNRAVDASALPATDPNSIAFGTQSLGYTNKINGTFDRVESFNYRHGATELYARQQLTWQIVTNGGVRQLRFLRPYEAGGLTIGSANSKPWPLTLWRRPLGGTNWGSALLTNSTNETWTDTNVSVGTTYEYRAQFDHPGYGWPFQRHFFAGIDMPPAHQRGNVILLVDSTLEPSLTNELAVLRTNLVGDGWTVKQAVAPRHDDLYWSTNRLNLTNVVNLIASNTVSGTTNVVFLLGHVTIPYSGSIATDNHGQGAPDGDHRGSWTTDAYYGYLNKTGWSDTNVVNNSSRLAVTNDGKLDPDALVGSAIYTDAVSVGRVPDMGVGRLDFARLPAFTGLSEVDLIKRYFAKDWRYRTNGIPTTGRVSRYWQQGTAALWELGSVNAAQSFAGAAFGTEPGRVFEGFSLRDQVPADLGVHYLSGHDILVQDGRGSNFYSTNFVSQAQEVPVIFRNVWFSFASDWARLESDNSFQIANNWLRASLGWTNYGLAMMGGFAWDYAPLGGGAPLAKTMTHGWEDQFTVPRFQSILGDPTLRLQRVTPASGVKASRSGSTVTLTWSPSPEANRGYFVYRSTAGLDGFSTPLNSTAGLSFTDTTSATNLLYQVRAAKLQTTGSGSFTNLSQGIFITVP